MSHGLTEFGRGGEAGTSIREDVVVAFCGLNKHLKCSRKIVEAVNKWLPFITFKTTRQLRWEKTSRHFCILALIKTS